MNPIIVKNISANFISAQQAERCGASTRELRHLLLAAQDITELLKHPRPNDADVVLARQYAESQIHTFIRIERLINAELNANNSL